ncbi:hypothetical protein INT45_002726 [Circinella minor]|uniref:Uncharacterized protein n=1 Tax=Circinella minor TaxID=1195481 RepID=A0A8H7S3Y8_9FUNG|nr:hypothetical protein INT45_002726 [Circinella minor]
MDRFINLDSTLRSLDEALKQLSTDGSTQNHAGLSTNCNDLREFLKQHPNVEQIMIDTMPTENTIHVYERHQLLNDSETL